MGSKLSTRRKKNTIYSNILRTTYLGQQIPKRNLESPLNIYNYVQPRDFAGPPPPPLPLRAPNKSEKCYDINDTTLCFVDAEDDMDFECNEYTSHRAKMSCGHTVTPMSLTNWCRRLLDDGEVRFVCGMTNCDAEWPYEEVCKMALLTPEEMKIFETKMFSNVKDYWNFRLCPGCKSCMVRSNLCDLSVRCIVCTKDKKMNYMFCWQCLREWKGPSPRSDRCDNQGCTNQQLETLRTCPDITFKSVVGVTGCPCIRACPKCGFLVEHDTTKCKNIICPQCKVEFCFVCLKLTKECAGQDGSYSKICSSGVAPRQTSLPVWQGI